MTRTSALSISVGQHSDKGRCEVNQDFHGVSSPGEALSRTRGIVVALADGIGSSQVSQVASEFAVMSLLDDYYSTPDAWSVKRSVERVLAATNSWLHSRTHSHYRHDVDRGYVCTLSAIVFKSATAHIFHVGDSRVHRVQGDALEPLTQDHRVHVSAEQSYLSRAVGFNPDIEIDYLALPLARGDAFLLTSDGVHEHVDAAFMTEAIRRGRDDLDAVARAIAEEALRRGSPDNLTVQVVFVDELPVPDAPDGGEQRPELLPPPPLLDARMTLDGYRIVRELHASSRSHVYLAVDMDTETLAVLKTPSIDMRDDPVYLERFLMEEWIARRIASAHVLKACLPQRERQFLYVAMEFVDGQTLTQWMIDNPTPALEPVRKIVEQIAKGLQAFHRLEMLHRDLRPDNIMIDSTGTVKIIDFGAASVAGILETAESTERGDIPGTAQYTAPEYFLGEAGSPRSDLFSLGVITYQMLSGRLPYGTDVAKCRTRSAQRNLRYESVLHDDREIPAWIDGVLKKAVHPDPLKRYEALSELVHDLRHPNSVFLSEQRPPLIERHPVRFWKAVSVVLAVIVVALLYGKLGR
jgi:serine/threonine protein phosphatase PrpC